MTIQQPLGRTTKLGPRRKVRNFSRPVIPVLSRTEADKISVMPAGDSMLAKGENMGVLQKSHSAIAPPPRFFDGRMEREVFDLIILGTSRDEMFFIQHSSRDEPNEW